jgi:two-component system LytT family response regulator
MRNKEFIVLIVGRNRKRKVFTDEILYCKADNTYTTLVFEDKRNLTVSKPIKEIESILSQENFYRISRSLIVNLNHCIELKTGKKPEILLINRESVLPEKKHVLEIERRMFTAQ